ncbi:uncharacterized protein I206_101796 [Kwoniella pini CBS 10737]|uniref:Cytoplasmic protein n=1 Tax=Kwoniella pini CBS 10737 TaxID=1296096 RepID=A0A1B9HVN6_9TREE|nr:uncharacterized protein I206_06231 [Kwoniella pini CBS 10737]OCF47335.1 hypothetical protein I206_06231 [Kwoniella pini CBS 10737]
MLAEQKIVLITGANRGLGLGLAKEYVSRGWKVIAAVRDPSIMPFLSEEVIVIKLDAAELNDANQAVNELKERYEVQHIDVVLANAAMGNHAPAISQIDPEIFTEHFNVNTRGTLLLYQATRELLLSSSSSSIKGKFIIVSSILSTLSRSWHKLGMVNYGITKVALNYLSKGIHFEEPNLISFTIDPGYVDTRLGQKASEFLNSPPSQTVEQTAPMMCDLIDKATREEYSGKLWRVDGTPAPY